MCASPAYEVTHFVAVSLIITIKRLRLYLDTRYAAGLSFDRLLMYHTHDEYCDMLLTLDTCSNRARSNG